MHPNYDPTWLNTTVPQARATNTVVVPAHTMATQYRYNTLNQVTAQLTPDGGTSYFWYDRLGRLVVSQNEKQAEVVSNLKRYSYTLYDPLGRITEVGEKPKLSSTPQMLQATSQDTLALQDWLNTTTGGEQKEQLTRTVYDEPWDPFCDSNDPSNNILCQKHLRNRVSYSYVKNTDDDSYLWDAATFYSYDIHGNVDTLLQDYKTGMGAINCTTGEPGGNRWKKLVYQYDLISGKVNEVAYQPGKADEFYHQYEYDAENRLTNVRTSKDHIYWENDAGYAYYKHGPLARTVLGETQVQGLDYAYTLQGWLKGVNSTTTLNSIWDIGQDGISGSSHEFVAKDILGFSLNYYDENAWRDYKPIRGTISFSRPGSQMSSLYNGNIAAMSVDLPGLLRASGSVATKPMLYNYKYDQLNRLVGMDAFYGLNETTNQWTPLAFTNNDYRERIEYDPNGNIREYDRNGTLMGGAPATAMDKLRYTYTPNTNKLEIVHDDQTLTSNYIEDIDDHTNDYEYDETGNLIQDTDEGIQDIKWNVYGKISAINKTDGSSIVYTYDAGGNRISKKVGTTTTVYVRDATGNIMSIYEINPAVNPAPVQVETNIYGSSRLGLQQSLTHPVESFGLEGDFTAGAQISTFTRGEKIFELSNHLGNVLTTISDKRLQVESTGSHTVDYYITDVLTVSDYYPGGMTMPGRKYSSASSSYRYGFNGKEKDKEVYGDGNEYDYGDRIYDPRISRWLSIDKMQKKHPGETPYLYTGGNPIYFIDPDGKDRIEHVRIIGNDGTVVLKTQTVKGVYRAIFHETNGGYFTRNDYEVYRTEDYRSGKKVTTAFSNTLYGAGHQEDIGVGEYLQIKWTGKNGPIVPQLPQLQVFGSGMSDPGWGSKADPDRPITSIDFGEFNKIISLIELGVKVPDLKSIDTKTAPGLVDKERKILEKQKKDHQDNDVKPDSAVCIGCDHKQDSTHIDDINGPGTFGKLRKEGKTDKTKNN